MQQPTPPVFGRYFVGGRIQTGFNHPPALASCGWGHIQNPGGRSWWWERVPPEGGGVQRWVTGGSWYLCFRPSSCTACALHAHCVHIAHTEAGILTQEYLSPDWLHSEAAKST